MGLPIGLQNDSSLKVRFFGDEVWASLRPMEETRKLIGPSLPYPHVKGCQRRIAYIHLPRSRVHVEIVSGFRKNLADGLPSRPVPASQEGQMLTRKRHVERKKQAVPAWVHETSVLHGPRQALDGCRRAQGDLVRLAAKKTTTTTPEQGATSISELDRVPLLIARGRCSFGSPCRWPTRTNRCHYYGGLY